MKPDKQTLQSWMNGDLSGEALHTVEKWVSENTQELEEMLNWDQTSQMLRENIVPEQDPPYPDFFHHKIRQSIEEEPRSYDSEKKTPELRDHSANSLWSRMRYLWAPAAVAAMTVCFYAGTQMSSSTTGSADLAGLGGASASQTAEIYVPQGGVSASVYENEQSGVILLHGLEAIPDAMDIVSAAPSGKPYPNTSEMVLVKQMNPNYL